ncbi:hypothetical protein SAMN04490185_4155 [Pseudomonas frederiksbergensis]|uniref:Uncharacterized protein n=1 Tax=Pseudomonas frederiksbergensis TaxID=104087 RepID=A0A1H5DEC7_9PSED|nr:hypothetical protein SAMN04490185_4155 [Pseudomonas frederiksbergensis]
MPQSDLLPTLLLKINENQLALEAAIMELTLWAEKRGATEVGENTGVTVIGRFCLKSRSGPTAWTLTGENAFFARCYVKSESGSHC